MNKRKILNLLHDTSLDEVVLESQTLKFVFSFMLEDDVEQTITVLSENVKNYSCIEYYRDNTKKEIDYKMLAGSDCSRFFLENKKVKILLENVYRDSFIKLKYETSDIIITGEIEKLEEFWSHNEAA